MPAPLTYRSSCVPLALAALLGEPVDRVANALWAANAARRGREVGGVLEWGTNISAARKVLADQLGITTQLLESAFATLAGWRAHHPSGRWLACIPYDRGAHAVAVRDGDVIAGDPRGEFDVRPVVFAVKLV